MDHLRKAIISLGLIMGGCSSDYDIDYYAERAPTAPVKLKDNIQDLIYNCIPGIDSENGHLSPADMFCPINYDQNGIDKLCDDIVTPTVTTLNERIKDWIKQSTSLSDIINQKIPITVVYKYEDWIDAGNLLIFLQDYNGNSVGDTIFAAEINALVEATNNSEYGHNYLLPYDFASCLATGDTPVGDQLLLNFHSAEEGFLFPFHVVYSEEDPFFAVSNNNEGVEYDSELTQNEEYNFDTAITNLRWISEEILERTRSYSNGKSQAGVVVFNPKK